MRRKRLGLRQVHSGVGRWACGVSPGMGSGAGFRRWAFVAEQDMQTGWLGWTTSRRSLKKWARRDKDKGCGKEKVGRWRLVVCEKVGAFLLRGSGKVTSTAKGEATELDREAE